jgi:hypothetical protein
LRAKGSSQEGILISSESRIDFDGVADVFGVTSGAAAGVFSGFEVSRVFGPAALDRGDRVTLGGAGEEFGELDCRADG